MELEGTKGLSSGIRIVRTAGAELDWSLPQAQELGHRRALIRGVQGVNCAANLISIDPGQASPRHQASSDHIIFQVKGSTKWHFDDRHSHEVHEQDLLYFPADRPYVYENSGKDVALFLSVIGKVGEWPAEVTYWLGADVLRTTVP